MPSFYQKTILVTGGAGFLGSHLCDRLLGEGHKVLSLDNFHTGSRLNHLHHADNPDFSLIEADVADPLPHLQVDEIYHLACPASPPHYQESPVSTLRTCLLGAINVLDLAVRTGARVMLASTSEVYGDPLVHPQPEDYFGNVNSFGERACYDEGKRAAEALFHAYAREKGADIRIVRIFNTYGPRMQPDDGRVVSNFVVEALQDQPITIYGDGSQTRSFCYVDDLIEGFVRLMASDVRTPVNLGNPGEFTMTELAALVVAMTGSRSPISYLPLPADDPRRRQPDISKAERLLGWKPTVSLEAGLGPTIAHFRKAVVPSTASAPLPDDLPPFSVAAE
ncbi:NAD-dependent epimerase/dehydratase family protein [uncultured Pleomorphomonas sp.]|uniref:NAD-dependent epimerase/dehydratase family protein n=1 Tax=uncultured Pleomorphomonas sp. TaxID=442121 RepID=A0A212LF31_9HYPH|nr:UDP-glucuronic acid decarboxylase family protein [uncultured Pleomorphomonas sp.]SCM76171.1 NAD-dependent epimerase/dehydratase family protein [uncultured Pleomorphomonas sp.]